MTDPNINDMADAMMQVRIMLGPMHDFLLGEVTYFENQGFTSEQARHMAYTEYCRIILQAPS